MKHSMRARLLITFALLSVVLVISTVWMTRVAFQQGFVNYLNLQTTQNLDRVSQMLADLYAETDSWDELAGNPVLWREMVDARRRPQRRPIDQLLPERFDPSGFLEGEAQLDNLIRPSGGAENPLDGALSNLTLLDTEANWIGGRQLQGSEGEMLSTSVQHLGLTVGYLTTPRATDIEAQLDRTFVEGQLRISIWIAILALAFVLPLALYIAARLLAPIRGLTRGVHNLTRGDYGSRINVERDDELGQLARDFNKLSSTLHANQTAQQRWISDISHELRTPVAVLEGEIYAILDGLRKPDTKGMESLAAEVKRLGRLIGDLHQLSKSDAGDLSYRMEPLKVKQVLEQVKQTFDRRMEEADLACELKLDQDNALIFGDESRLNQLFSNLLENACRYTDGPGKILIELHCLAGQAVLTVSDSVPGVTDTELPQLFDRLYRVEQSRNRASGGSGLGLSICRNIANAHGATLEADHSDLGGLKMTLTMPLHRREIEDN
jgi:two-component system sensor histidine kinase BaeS